MIVADFCITGMGLNGATELIANRYNNSDNITMVGVFSLHINQYNKGLWEDIDNKLKKQKKENKFARKGIVFSNTSYSSLMQDTLVDRVLCSMAPYDRFTPLKIANGLEPCMQSTEAMKLIGEQAAILSYAQDSIENDKNAGMESKGWAVYSEE